MADFKSLVLVRHAKSSWKHPHLSDHDRPLNKRGHRDAPIMAERLRQELAQLEITLDCVYTSTAERARSIAEPIQACIGVPIQPDAALYTFSKAAFANVLKALPDDKKACAVVGHSPAITEVINALAEQPIANLPTSGYVVFKIETTHWNRLFTAKHSVIGYNYPKRNNT